MTPATADEIADLLGERADDTLVERIAAVGASIDEIGEAFDDYEYERRFGETRESSSARVEEVREILEELPQGEDILAESEVEEKDEIEGLTVIEGEDLGGEPP